MVVEHEAVERTCLQERCDAKVGLRLQRYRCWRRSSVAFSGGSRLTSTTRARSGPGLPAWCCVSMMLFGRGVQVNEDCLYGVEVL